MEHLFCLCCHKELRPGRDTHHFYCAQCITDAFAYLEQLEVPEHCTICQRASCYQCPNLTADVLPF